MKRVLVTDEEIKELFKFAEKDIRFGVSLKGALSQIRHKLYLESLGYSVETTQSDNRGLPDFIVEGVTMEHKRARKQCYADGTYKVEIQKSRGERKTRLYDIDFSNVVSADISEHTGKKNDYRYAFTSNLEVDKNLKSKIKSLQRIDENWTSSFKSLLENKK
jgi:hypothetical protein|tara:strand:+ start:479 stop:964 length:486 start_codon:yes stop_codon:yes gene_type:complete